jgi:hypothetical protein
MVMVTQGAGHPQRSLHAYAITLATPVVGAQLDYMGLALRSMSKMNDPSLKPLCIHNLYLEILLTFARLEGNGAITLAATG